MECNKYRSVLSIMDPLSARRSYELVSLSPTSFTPVSRKPLSFSIRAILGLDEKRDQDFPITGNTSPSELSVHIPSPSPSSPLSSLDSNITTGGFSSDCDSEPDQLSTHSEKPAKKKRQRTTFSPIEVWGLELAYKRRPYLMAEDEEELVQRLGITARSLRYWFQNRRAKSRKEGRELTFIRETSQSNRFPARVSKLYLERMQPWQPQFPVVQARQLESKFQSMQSGPNFLPPSAEVRYPSSFRSNQFISRPPFQVPMYHPDQFKIRPAAEPTILPFSRSSHRYKPY